MTPSPEMPSYVRPVVASYMGWPARLAPKYQAATKAARCLWPGRSDREECLQAGVDAVRDLGAVDRRREPAVVGTTGREEEWREAGGVTDRCREENVFVECGRGSGEGRGHLGAPGVPVGDRLAPRQQRTERPLAGRAGVHLRNAFGETREGSTGSGRSAGVDVRRESEDRFGGGVRAVHDQPRGETAAVDDVVLAVADQDLTFERSDRQLEAVAEEGAKARSARRKTAYPSPNAQTVRASQYDGPESDGSGSSTGSALGLSVPSGCIQSTTFPLGDCRNVRDSQQSRGRSAARTPDGRVSSAAGRRRLPARCRPRCRRLARRCSVVGS